MEKRPKWDAHEVAILINEYQKIREGKITRGEAIKKVSMILRDRALKQGIDISDTFRNENGIKMRFCELDCIFSEGEVGLKNTSNLFREVAEVYRTDREQFNRLLEENGQIIEKVNKNMGCLFDWVKNKTKKKDVSNIRNNLELIEEYANRRGIISCSLEEIDNPDKVIAVYTLVLYDKRFKSKFKDKYVEMVKAVSLFSDYFKTKNTQTNKKVKGEQGTREENGDIDKNKYANSENNSEDENNNEFEQWLLDKKDGATKEDIVAAFPSYSSRQIKLALEECHSVHVLKRYLHKNNISDYDEMAEIMLEILNKQFKTQGNYTSSLQLYNEARIRLDDFFFYNGAFDSRAEVFDLAVHLFSQEKYKGNQFVFLNNMHIWKEEPDYTKDFCGLMVKYAKEHNNTFTRDEAIAYFEWIGSSTPVQTFSYVIFNTGSKVFLQFDENRFVLKDVLGISEQFLIDLSGQLNNLVEEADYISFGEIDDFFYSTLPKLPEYVYWTPLLLEDVLRVFDVNFFTVEAGKDNDKKTIPAAIIKKNSPYNSFEDVVWAEVSKDYSLPKEFTASEFRQFLLEKGFIRGSEKMWNVHKTVAGDIRFFWKNDFSSVTIN